MHWFLQQSHWLLSTQFFCWVFFCLPMSGGLRIASNIFHSTEKLLRSWSASLFKRDGRALQLDTPKYHGGPCPTVFRGHIDLNVSPLNNFEYHLMQSPVSNFLVTEEKTIFASYWKNRRSSKALGEFLLLQFFWRVCLVEPIRILLDLFWWLFSKTHHVLVGIVWEKEIPFADFICLFPLAIQFSLF